MIVSLEVSRKYNNLMWPVSFLTHVYPGKSNHLLLTHNASA